MERTEKGGSLWTRLDLASNSYHLHVDEFLSKELDIPPEEVLLTYFVEEIVRLSSKILLPIGTKARDIKKDKAFVLLPHDLRPVVEEATNRPPALFVEEGKIEQISILAQKDKLEGLIDLCDEWKRIVYFLLPPFETWKAQIDFKKTNILSFEEFSVDMALSTAFCRLILDNRFEVSPLTIKELEKLKEKLDRINLDLFIEKEALELLEPMFEMVHPSEQGQKAVLGGIENTLKELKKGPTLEPQFLEGLLVYL